ncbi:Protein SNT-7, partial [Aphelenchoides avenae]
MMIYEVPDDAKPIILTYVVSGTLAVMLLVVIILLIQRRRNRLNWYEQNLLEIASSPPNYVRCKALPRLDTDDDRYAEPSCSYTLARATRKQSRIHKVAKTSVEIPIDRDLTELFAIPKPPKSKSSMFRNPDENQIDRGLYQNTVSDGYPPVAVLFWDLFDGLI